MQKPANRILSALLVLVMVLSVLPASVFATGNAEGPFAGWSLTLGDNIGVNFYLKEEAANYSVNVTVAGNDAATTAATKDGYYVVTANVAAAQMTDTIALSVVNGDQTVHTGEYSVRQYAETILTGSYDEEVKLMVQNMLNYGAAAQNYFGYNAEKLANAGYELASAAAVPAEVPAINVQDDLAGIALYGMSLLFQNKTSVRFYFHGSGDMNSYTFQIGDQAYTPVAKNGQYYVQVDGINPQDLDKTIELVVSKDGKSLTVSYSPMTYIVRKYNSADSAESLKALVQGMYGYHLEAIAYQKYLEIVKIDTLVEHPDSNNNWTSGGIYMATQEPNDAPYKSDWTLEYAPTSSSVIKRIRNGETIDVAIAGRGTIVKYDADKYYLNVNSWTMGENAPAMDGDIYIIEGDFYNAANDATIRFAKNYIYLNGTNAEFSKEMPTLPTVVEGGMLQKVDGYGWTGGTGALIFKMANTAPNGGYAPTDASNIKLIRNGETYDVAYVGVNVINKSNDTWYTLEFWTIVNYKPLLANDILVIEGEFKQASSKTTLNISKTYVLLNADGSATFSAEMPSLTTVIDAGMMSAHANGWKSSADAAGNLQFAMAANDAPTGYYRPTSAANVKLIRDGATYDVGHNLRDTISKVNNDQYILEFWTIADHKPMVANDILIVEGEFRQESSNTILNVAKTYILLKADGTATFSAEMPSLATIIDAGVMSKHSSNGWNADALYFSMAENEAPAADAIRYKPENASNVKLIRDGVTYDVGHNARETIVKASATGYYIALWTLGDYKPLKANDILIVEGNFTNAANNTTLNISKTYILIKGDGTAVFSTEMPSLATVIDAGVMSKHSSNGWNADALYFSMAENAAPIADAIRYKPEYASNVKLIRDGATYDVGHNQRETIVKASATGYYIALWTLGDYKPLKANDILIVEGNFTNAANNTTLNISKTYILIKGDGTAVFSTEMPSLGTYVEGGLLIGNDNGWTGDGIYFSMNENEAPYNTDWSLRYKPASSAVIKLLRDGTTTNIANTAAETLVKYSETNYTIATWMFGSYGLKAGDILIVEGEFLYAAENVTLNVQKSYILLNADGSVTVSATEPVPATEVDCGVMGEHADGSASEIFFSMADNAVPVDEEVEYPYSGTVQLVNGSAVSSVNVNIYKLDADMYYLELDGAELTNGSYLIVEGAFENADNGYIMNISKTYVLAEDDALVYSETEPAAGIQAGMLKAYSENKWNSTDASNPGNLWFALDNNNATNGAYRPTANANVKLIRNGETYVVGHTARDTINKINDSWYVFEFWTIADYKPMVAGDILIVEGSFYQASSDTTLNISKTYILLNENNTATYSATEPVPEAPGSMMQAYSENKWSSTDASNPGNLWFALDNNDAPNGAYRPTANANVKLIRNGETYVVGHTARDTINKINNSWYVFEFWTIADYKPMLANDILIVEGDFYQASSDTTLSIEKTYVLLNADGTASYFDSEPSIGPETNHGVMNVTNWQKPAYNPDGSANDGGLYFTLAENDVIYTTDWATQYKPVSADVIKLIRGGVETNVANTAAGMIIKYSATEYYLQFWPITKKPMQAGDIMIVEGQFKNESNGSVLNIAKTYIVFNENGTVSVFENSPMSIDAGTMSAYAAQNWFDSNYTALYFVLDSNIAPAASDWSVRYMPNSASNIKLIRGGQTYEIANTGAEIIVKIEDGLYALALDNWWWNSYAPIQDGDILVIEGAFSNAATGYTLNIEKTSISFVSKENDDVRFAKAVNTEFGDVTLPTSDKSVTIGVWNGSHHVFSDARLAELQAAGITKIIGIDPQWIGSENNWDMNYLLDRMQAYGISVVAYARQRTADGSKYSGDEWDGVTKPDYADHPALIGFLMQDEPSAQDFSKLQMLKAKFDAVMPAGKLFYVNLYSESAASTAWYGNLTGIYRDYEKDYVDAFISQLNPSVLSWDSYPLLINQGIRTGYFHNFEVMATKNVPKWFTLLSSGHDTTTTSYATPTYEELRWQMAVAMTYGVSNLDHYVYTSHAEDYSTMLDYDTQTVTDLYYDVMKADNEIKAWDEIYMAYDWQGVAGVRAGSSSTMLDKLENEINLTQNGLSAVSTNRDLLVGVFDYAGSKAYMVTNAGSAGTSDVGDGKNYIVGDATVTLTLDAADYKCVAVIDQGEISYVAVENNTVTLTVEAYEGVFVIPVLN